MSKSEKTYSSPSTTNSVTATVTSSKTCTLDTPPTSHKKKKSTKSDKADKVDKADKASRADKSDKADEVISVTETSAEMSKSTTTATTTSKTCTIESSVPCLGKSKSGKGVLLSATCESKTKHAMRKFLFRIKESIGLVKKTEISKQFSDSLEHLDHYKLCLDTVAEAVCHAIQDNPKYCAEDFKMEMIPSIDKDQNELVASYLRKRDCFEDYKNRKNQIRLYEMRGSEHREYIRKAIRTMSNIRSFIQNDYWVIGVQRTELDTLRREMDFAKSELKSAKDEQVIAIKEHHYKVAVAAFQDKLKQITKMLDDLTNTKALHIADLEDLMHCTRKYHERIAHLSKEVEQG